MLYGGPCLGAFNVKYMPCTAIKGQVLADFVVEFTENVAGDKKAEVGVLMISPSTIAA